MYATRSQIFIYGRDTYYRFNVSAYMSSLLSTGGVADRGFFVLQEPPTSVTEVDRGVLRFPEMGNSVQPPTARSWYYMF